MHLSLVENFVGKDYWSIMHLSLVEDFAGKDHWSIMHLSLVEDFAGKDLVNHASITGRRLLGKTTGQSCIYLW